jgi:hypothetical protein
MPLVRPSRKMRRCTRLRVSVCARERARRSQRELWDPVGREGNIGGWQVGSEGGRHEKVTDGGARARGREREREDKHRAKDEVFWTEHELEGDEGAVAGAYAISVGQVHNAACLQAAAAAIRMMIPMVMQWRCNNERRALYYILFVGIHALCLSVTTLRYMNGEVRHAACLLERYTAISFARALPQYII